MSLARSACRRAYCWLCDGFLIEFSLEPASRGDTPRYPTGKYPEAL
jgi:hypothetical protein